MTVPALLTVVLFTFGFSIFYVLLALERKVWGLVLSHHAPPSETDVRFVHQSLKRLIAVLPPSNGIVVVGGFAALVWQGVQRDWDWQAAAVLAWYFAGQLYIIVIGRIAAAVKDVWTTPSDGELVAVTMGVRNLVRQHRNGLIHALGVLILQAALILRHS